MRPSQVLPCSERSVLGCWSALHHTTRISKDAADDARWRPPPTRATTGPACRTSKGCATPLGKLSGGRRVPGSSSHNARNFCGVERSWPRPFLVTNDSRSFGNSAFLFFPSKLMSVRVIGLLLFLPSPLGRGTAASDTVANEAGFRTTVASRKAVPVCSCGRIRAERERSASGGPEGCERQRASTPRSVRLRHFQNCSSFGTLDQTAAA